MHNRSTLGNIGLVTFPLSKAGNIPLSHLVEVLGELSTSLYVITGNEADIQPLGQRYVFRVDHKNTKNTIARIINFIYTQLHISYQLIKLINKVNLWVFFIGGEGLVLPMITAKLWRSRVLLALAGFPERSSRKEKDPLSRIIGLLASINLTLSDGIAVYSKRNIAERNLEKYSGKISIAYEHFLDFNIFKVDKPLNKRGKVVGYLGSLSQNKGVPNLIDAIPKILERDSSIEFLIGGEGNLRAEIQERISKNDLSGKVKYVGWIPHDDIPEYLNELKLLILPSYSEGLPNIILEAMACGTPVLVTPVGAIPDIIIDGETGFIMEYNNSECIASNILRALNHPKLQQVANNGREMVENEFTLDKAAHNYRKIFITW